MKYQKNLLCSSDQTSNKKRLIMNEIGLDIIKERFDKSLQQRANSRHIPSLSILWQQVCKHLVWRLELLDGKQYGEHLMHFHTSSWKPELPSNVIILYLKFLQATQNKQQTFWAIANEASSRLSHFKMISGTSATTP